ncbi:hypothetical protein [Amycolatopsis sp. RTGN1]|uniref:ATP dependent DNA ligase n=1 Tax=Amycolatopsis ponsaeliensis TaxID=2992142 RepID=UPI003306D1BF
MTSALVVGGWLRGRGRRVATFGALLVGAYDRWERLVWLGSVGTGFTDGSLRVLRARLDALSQPISPFIVQPPVPECDVSWVEPAIVVDVMHEVPRGSRSRLQAAVWKRIRFDLSPEAIALPPQFSA